MSAMAEAVCEQWGSVELLTWVQSLTSLCSSKNTSLHHKWNNNYSLSQNCWDTFVSLSPQCWCTRFGDWTAINNFERDKGSMRRKKTVFGPSVPTIFVSDCRCELCLSQHWSFHPSNSCLEWIFSLQSKKRFHGNVYFSYFKKVNKRHHKSSVISSWYRW